MNTQQVNSRWQSCIQNCLAAAALCLILHAPCSCQDIHNNYNRLQENALNSLIIAYGCKKNKNTKDISIK